MGRTEGDRVEELVVDTVLTARVGAVAAAAVDVVDTAVVRG
jgi:hypothetical protein